MVFKVSFGKEAGVKLVVCFNLNMMAKKQSARLPPARAGEKQHQHLK
jgi:hypothetical protein